MTNPFKKLGRYILNEISLILFTIADTIERLFEIIDTILIICAFVILLVFAITAAIIILGGLVWLIGAFIFGIGWLLMLIGIFTMTHTLISGIIIMLIIIIAFLAYLLSK